MTRALSPERRRFKTPMLNRRSQNSGSAITVI